MLLRNCGSSALGLHVVLAVLMVVLVVILVVILLLASMVIFGEDRIATQISRLGFGNSAVAIVLVGHLCASIFL